MEHAREALRRLDDSGTGDHELISDQQVNLLSTHRRNRWQGIPDSRFIVDLLAPR